MSGMNGPQWLADIVGALALLSALYAAARIADSARLKRSTDYAAELGRVLFGVALAGLLIPGMHVVRRGGSARLWIVVAGVLTAWVAFALLRDLAVPGLRWRHVSTVLLGGATIYLLSAYQGMGSMTSMPGSSMPGMSMASQIVPAPTLDLMLALALTATVVVLIDRASSGVATFGAPTTLGGGDQTPVEYAPVGAHIASAVLALVAAYLLVMYFL